MAVILAFIVTLVCAPAAAAVARRLGIVDRPGPLKVQAVPVPYLGGAAVLAGIGAALATQQLAPLLPLTFAFALGLADDVVDLPVATRFACELLVGVAAAAVLPVHDVASALLVVALVVFLLNAVNLLDGLDGLAVGVSLASAICFAVLLRGAIGDLAAAAAGAFAGFAVWNRPPARIYLGDSGSYLIGTTLAVLLSTALLEEPPARASGALLFVAVPVADTVIALVRRRRTGVPLFVGDRGHVYDQLVDRGHRPGVVTAGCIGAQVVLGIVGLAISALAATPAVVATVVVVLAVGVAALRTFALPRD